MMRASGGAHVRLCRPYPINATLNAVLLAPINIMTSVLGDYSCASGASTQSLRSHMHVDSFKLLCSSQGA